MEVNRRMNAKYMITKLYIKLSERVFTTQNGIRLRYIYKHRDNGRKLIVVFCAFAGHHIKSRYNYIKSLCKSENNCLFILDNFGYENVGSYYIGNHGELFFDNSIEQLVNYIYQKGKSSEKIFCGTSKGGSAALLYGLMLNVDTIISGSPQYRIGKYLSKNDYHRCILDSICINSGEKQIDAEWLDTIIDKYLMLNQKKTKIKLIYSSLEPDWPDIKELILSIEANMNCFEKYDEKYIEHNDIGKVFPKYLREI